MKPSAPDVVWHYTTAMPFLAVLKAGRVEVSKQDIGPREKPVAWFSANPTMEYTIQETAVERADGTFVRPKTPADYRILGMGLYRIAAPAERMLRYADLLRQANIGLTRRRMLERTAKIVGANPYEWYGQLQPFQLDDSLGLEIYDGTAWRSLPREGAAARVLEEQRATSPLFQELIASKRSDKAPSASRRIL